MFAGYNIIKCSRLKLIHKLVYSRSLNFVQALTSTDNTSIFRMTTVVGSDSSMITVEERGLRATAHKVVKENGSSSLSKECKEWGAGGYWKVKILYETWLILCKINDSIAKRLGNRLPPFNATRFSSVAEQL